MSRARALVSIALVGAAKALVNRARGLVSGAKSLLSGGGALVREVAACRRLLFGLHPSNAAGSCGARHGHISLTH